MTIGDLLKQYRINQNKTLQEFAGNIIDRSYYGKVERNVHQISAENLINLLRYNQIDATEFIETLDQNYQSQIQIQREIIEKYQVRESILVKKSLFSLAINVLVLSIEENKFENIDFANRVPTNPDLFFYKSAMTFFTYFIQYKKNQDKSALQYCDTIIKSFCLVGMPEYGEELQKFKDKYK